jgi:hypothetical protein
MELVLTGYASRKLLSHLPAGLTHLHLFKLKMDSLTPVASGLPRLRMLHLHVDCSHDEDGAHEIIRYAALLLHFLMCAEQRDALTVVLDIPELERQDKLNSAFRMNCDAIARLAAKGIAPLRTPALVWMDDGPDVCSWPVRSDLSKRGERVQAQ